MTRLIFPLLFITSLAQAQFHVLTLPGDTVKITASDSLRMQRSSAMEGFADYRTYEIFDTTQNMVLSYAAKATDTVNVRWGVTQMACRSCPGFKIFTRLFLLTGPGLNTLTVGLPVDNPDPAFDEAWTTSMGMLFIALDEDRQPRTVLLRRPNGFSIKWNQRVLPQKK